MSLLYPNILPLLRSTGFKDVWRFAQTLTPLKLQEEWDWGCCFPLVCVPYSRKLWILFIFLQMVSLIMSVLTPVSGFKRPGPSHDW